MSTLPKTYRVTTATGDGEVTTLGVTNLSLDIQGKPYVWNFIVYGIIGFDVLLGMDWLTAHHVTTRHFSRYCGPNWLGVAQN